LFVRVGRPPLQTEVDGVKLRGYLRHRSFLANIAEARYEPYLRRLFLEAVRSTPSAFVVDGGAHIGLYTIFAARELGAGGRVLAFEPDPYNFRALTFNVARNGCRAVSLMPMALINKVGQSTFQQSLGTISSSLARRPDTGPFKPIQVRTTTLDSELMDLEPEALVVKLDLEGAEPCAIEGMREVISRCATATLLVELNPSALERGNSSPEKLLDALKGLGLHTALIDDSRSELRPIGSHPKLAKGNLLATKRPQ
jgi:FkbM family methyltransferase